MKQLFYLLLLSSLVACENEDEVQEPTLQTITVTPVKTESTETFTDISFGTSKVGYICGSMGTLLKTTDGGTTWTKVSSSIPEKYPDCYFVNNSKIILRTSNAIYHSVDGGVTWEKDYTLTDITGQLTNMKFTDSRTGYVIGNNGFLAKITLN